MTQIFHGIFFCGFCGSVVMVSVVILSVVIFLCGIFGGSLLEGIMLS